MVKKLVLTLCLLFAVGVVPAMGVATSDSTTWAGSFEMNAKPLASGAWASYWMTQGEDDGTPDVINVQPVPGEPGNNMVNFYQPSGAMWYKSVAQPTFNFTTGASIEGRLQLLYGTTGQNTFFTMYDAALGKNVDFKFSYTNSNPTGNINVAGVDYAFAANSGQVPNPFHTFRVTALGSVFNLYIDDNTTPVVSGSTASGLGWAPSAAEPLAFGNQIITNNWDHLRWTTEGAFAPVPEPATMILLTIGGLMLRKKSNM